MSSKGVGEDCLGWAARDASGVLSPYKFSRRYICISLIPLYIMEYGLMECPFSVNHHILFSWQPNFQKLLDIAVPGLMLHIFISFMYTFFVSFLPCLGIKVDF